MKTILALAAVLLLTACGQPQIHVGFLPESKGGKARYSVSGLVMVPKFEDGVTKPYTDRYMRGVCLNGYKYVELNEAVNKEMITSIWVQWVAVLECK